MNSPPAPARDHLVLKVALGVVIGGLVLFGIAKYCGLVIVAGSAGLPAPPVAQPATASAPTHPASLPPPPAAPAKNDHAASPATTANAPTPAAPASTEKPVASMAAASSGADANKLVSNGSGKLEPADHPASGNTDSEPSPDQDTGDAANDAVTPPNAPAAADRPRKLLPVPEGYRCIDGRLFKVSAHDFEQVTDGSEKKYCP